MVTVMAFLTFLTIIVDIFALWKKSISRRHFTIGFALIVVKDQSSGTDPYY